MAAATPNETEPYEEARHNTMSAYPHAGKDFYRILRVSQTADFAEIKKAYRKLAIQLHPDTNDGCSQKEAEFKKVAEAYDVLSDTSKRREYDFKIGLRFSTNRRTPPPGDYRKVYTSRPPPHWKTVFDHARHYDMHYGDGMMKEAVRHARKTAEQEGAYEYRSPLGRGFAFASDDPLSKDNFNPYSKKSPQGPPKVVFEYEESSNISGKHHLNRRERIVTEMHHRRGERRRKHAERMQRAERLQRTMQYPYSTMKNGNNSGNQSDECVIL
jgi:curved DNA-binding protein CbpA